MSEPVVYIVVTGPCAIAPRNDAFPGGRVCWVFARAQHGAVRAVAFDSATTPWIETEARRAEFFARSRGEPEPVRAALWFAAAHAAAHATAPYYVRLIQREFPSEVGPAFAETETALAAATAREAGLGSAFGGDWSWAALAAHWRGLGPVFACARGYVPILTEFCRETGGSLIHSDMEMFGGVELGCASPRRFEPTFELRELREPPVPPAAALWYKSELGKSPAREYFAAPVWTWGPREELRAALRALTPGGALPAPGPILWTIFDAHFASPAAADALEVLASHPQAAELREVFRRQYALKPAAGWAPAPVGHALSAAAELFAVEPCETELALEQAWESAPGLAKRTVAFVRRTVDPSGAPPAGTLGLAARVLTGAAREVRWLFFPAAAELPAEGRARLAALGEALAAAYPGKVPEPPARAAFAAIFAFEADLAVFTPAAPGDLQAGSWLDFAHPVFWRADFWDFATRKAFLFTEAERDALRRLACARLFFARAAAGEEAKVRAYAFRPSAALLHPDRKVRCAACERWVSEALWADGRCVFCASNHALPDRGLGAGDPSSSYFRKCGQCAVLYPALRAAPDLASTSRSRCWACRRGEPLTRRRCDNCDQHFAVGASANGAAWRCAPCSLNPEYWMISRLKNIKLQILIEANAEAFATALGIPLAGCQVLGLGGPPDAPPKGPLRPPGPRAPLGPLRLHGECVSAQFMGKPLAEYLDAEV